MSDMDATRRLILAVERLENAAKDQAQQARHIAAGTQQLLAAQSGLGEARQVEETRFREAMVALFQEQQQRTEAALQPVVGKAWRGLIAVALGFALLYVGLLALLHHEYQRLKDAEAKADDAEVSAEIRQASRHVEINSCGGRPCIRIDKDAPVWKSRGSEYILVDGKPVN